MVGRNREEDNESRTRRGGRLERVRSIIDRNKTSSHEHNVADFGGYYEQTTKLKDLFRKLHLVGL